MGERRKGGGWQRAKLLQFADGGTDDGHAISPPVRFGLEFLDLGVGESCQPLGQLRVLGAPGRLGLGEGAELPQGTVLVEKLVEGEEAVAVLHDPEVVKGWPSVAGCWVLGEPHAARMVRRKAGKRHRIGLLCRSDYPRDF